MMAEHRSPLLALLCAVVLLTLSVCPAHGSTAQQEIDALNALWQATGGPNGDWKVAWEEVEVCDRAGVVCDPDGHVVVLKLEDFGLNGVLPDEIGDLQWLEFFSVMGNKLEGTLPDSAGRLTALQTLNLGGNQLQGPFPACIRNMTNLGILFMGPNRFDGPLPFWIGTLPLVMLGVTDNKFSGRLPTSLGNLAGLTDLYVDGNEFEGGLPPSLQNIEGLVNLVVHHNHLSGEIPTWLGSFSNLEWFELDNNDFSGVLPTSIFGGLKKLRKIHVGNNPLLHGTLSADMFTPFHKQLFSVFLSGTKLTGEIPASLASLPALTELRVQDACFVGNLTEDLCPMLPNLTFADFSNDFFECPIPDCFEEYVTCVPRPAELPARCIVAEPSSTLSSGPPALSSVSSSSSLPQPSSAFPSSSLSESSWSDENAASTFAPCKVALISLITTLVAIVMCI